MIGRPAAAIATGVAVFVSGFVLLTRLHVVPLYMHDDYEYTYPSFNLVRAGDVGSPLLGSGLNIQHRTYNFTMYYYAAVHSMLIRAFGDRPESINLANIWHFALLIACVTTLGVFTRNLMMAVAAGVGFVSDRVVLDAAFAGRPEMTAAFGYGCSLIAFYLWHSSERPNRWLLGAAMLGAVLAGLTHPAGVIVLAPMFVLVVALNVRRLLLQKNLLAFLLPATVPFAVYAYFIATDDWRNIVAQMMGNGVSNIIWPKRYAMVVEGRFGDLLRTAAPVWDHFSNIHFWYALPGLVVGTAIQLRGETSPQLLDDIRVRMRAFVYWTTAFALAMLMHWLFLKDFFAGYTAIYRVAWYLALGFSVSMLTAPLQFWCASRGWSDLYAGAMALGLALYVSSHDAAALADRLHAGFVSADYGRFERELNAALAAAGGRSGDLVYCPSPFGTYLRANYRVVTHGGERYADGLWPESFDAAIESKRALATDPASLVYLKRIAFIGPKWIVTWDHDYSDLQGFTDFVRSFPASDSDIQIVEAGGYDSQCAYHGGIRIYRVAIDGGFAKRLDRSVHVERRLGSRI